MTEVMECTDVAVPEEKATMTLSASAVDVDDDVTDPSNGDCAAASVSFRPASSSSVVADPSQLASSGSADSTARRAAVSALSNNDAQRPAAEATSAPASSVADDEERE